MGKYEVYDDCSGENTFAKRKSITEFYKFIDEWRIAVKNDVRKKGIGSQMLRNVISYCKGNNINILNLEVRSSNIAGHRLYEKFGFEKVGERKKYYSDNNEDAYLYTLIIEG